MDYVGYGAAMLLLITFPAAGIALIAIALLFTYPMAAVILGIGLILYKLGARA